MPLSPLLRPARFDDLTNWRHDALGEALAAFRRSAPQLREKPYRTGSLGIEARAFEEAYAEALTVDPCDQAAARSFFMRSFVPFRVEPDSARGGHVTGFYEPVAAASPTRSDGYHVPLLAPPDDLVAIDDDVRPAELDPYLAFGRRTDIGIVEYHDRAAIERGVLGERARPIAWLADKVDAFFIHVQGAARLVMPDGATKRVTYAAKSGQRFTGPGGVLVSLGEIEPGKVTMQSIRHWLGDHPERVDEILQRNRSYIFFREASVEDPALGPIAAAKVPLTPGRSIAVDRLLHTFGTPVHVDAPSLTAFGGQPFNRLMVAQDTGSAIVGSARGDLFAGSGDAAGEIAGVVNHQAVFHVLVPRTIAGVSV